MAELAVAVEREHDGEHDKDDGSGDGPGRAECRSRKDRQCRQRDRALQAAAPCGARMPQQRRGRVGRARVDDPQQPLGLAAARTGASVVPPVRPRSPATTAVTETSRSIRRNGVSCTSAPRSRSRSIVTTRRVSRPREAVSRSPSSVSVKFQSTSSEPAAPMTRTKRIAAAVNAAMPRG